MFARYGWDWLSDFLDLMVEYGRLLKGFSNVRAARLIPSPTCIRA
jgi:hypothetical protein